jgi:hypothetical protein
VVAANQEDSGYSSDEFDESTSSPVKMQAGGKKTIAVDAAVTPTKQSRSRKPAAAGVAKTEGSTGKPGAAAVKQQRGSPVKLGVASKGPAGAQVLGDLESDDDEDLLEE